MKKRVIRCFILFICFGILLTIYGFFIEPKRITLHHYDLDENADQTSIKLLQLSDIHLKHGYTTDQLKKIVQAANNEKPDIIVFTGDLFDNYAKYGPVNETIAILSELTASLGKFSIWGNHDYGGGAAAVYSTIWQNSGFQLLKNTGKTLETANGKSIYLASIDETLFGAPSIGESLASRAEADYTILLSHEPDVTESAVNYDISLILSGHSHGGQVNLPFFPVTPILAKKYIGGFYSLSSQTTLYVNTGLGTTLLHVRLGVPPEIAIFELNI